jgi:hypothetical protein
MLLKQTFKAMAKLPPTRQQQVQVFGEIQGHLKT